MAIKTRLAKLEQRNPARDDSFYLECLRRAGRGDDLFEELGVEIEPVTEVHPDEVSPYFRALWQHARDEHLQRDPSAPLQNYSYPYRATGVEAA